MGNLNISPINFPHSSDPWLPTGIQSLYFSPSCKKYAHFTTFSTLSAHDAKCLSLRAQGKDCLVSVLAVMEEGREGFKCEGGGYQIGIERIQYRLGDLGVLGSQDAIYVIRQGVKAIGKLGQIFQGFEIDEDAIGLNGDGECKFWINSNLFRNQVELVLGNKVEENKLNRGSLDWQSQENELRYSQKNSWCLNKNKQISQQNLNFLQKLKNSSKPSNSKNLNKTFQNFLSLIQSKFVYGMTSEQQKLYKQTKQLYLKSTPSSKKLFNEAITLLQKNQSQKSTESQETHQFYYDYSKENMEILTEQLSYLFKVRKNYRIKLPEGEDKIQFEISKFNQKNSGHEKNVQNKSRLGRANSTSHFIDKSISRVKSKNSRLDKSKITLNSKATYHQKTASRLQPNNPQNPELSRLSQNQKMPQNPKTSLKKSKTDTQNPQKSASVYQNAIFISSQPFSAISTSVPPPLPAQVRKKNPGGIVTNTHSQLTIKSTAYSYLNTNANKNTSANTNTNMNNDAFGNYSHNLSNNSHNSINVNKNYNTKSQINKYNKSQYTDSIHNNDKDRDNQDMGEMNKQRQIQSQVTIRRNDKISISMQPTVNPSLSKITSPTNTNNNTIPSCQSLHPSYPSYTFSYSNTNTNSNANTNANSYRNSMDQWDREAEDTAQIYVVERLMGTQGKGKFYI